MKHFSDYLQRAIRSSADAPPSPPMTDWSAYYVDYRLLKSHVSSYMRRRMKLAELLRDGDQVYLTEEDLRLVLAMADDVEDNPTDIRSDDDIVRMVMEDHIGDGQQGSGDTCACTAENVLGSAACHDYFQYVDEPHDLQPLDPAEAERRLSRVERSSFTRLLDQELERAASFHSTQLVYLSKSIAALDDVGNERGEQQHESQPTANMPDLTPTMSFAEVKEQYERVGNEILELLAFVVTNVICLRQILIRYDAFVRTFDGRPLTQWYFQEKMGNSDGMDGASSDHLTDLFHLEALLELETSFAALMTKKYESSYGDGDEPNALEHGSVSSPYLQAFTKQAAGFRSLLDKTSISVSRAAGGHIVKRDRFVNTMRTLQFYFLRGSGLRGMEMEPKLLLMRGRHLKEEMRMIAVWRETRDFSAASQKDEGEKIDPKNIFPLLLNFIACFIYMMGHYIIEPSSAYYAEALGFDDSMAGLMVGLSPTFAIVSAVGYSIWTNHNYKTPILFACSLAFMGNLLYACALSYQSMTICLVGRALTGLGATKVINRRYVADATTIALRTPANAALALGTALGAAMGPALALVIADLDFNFVLPLFGQQNFNAMTGPGFIMALLWLLFAIVTSFAFTEPVRSGVEELKQREAVSSSDPSSPMRHKSSCFTKNADNEWDEISLEEAMEIITKSSKSGSLRHCLQNMTKPVVVTMAIIFMKRVALEFLVGSTSIITKNRYGWSIKNVGTLHFANGMIVIPITILAGWLSQFFQDRYLTLRFMVITLVGLLSLIDFSDLLGSAADENDTYNEGYPLAIGPVRYIIGSLVAFSSIEANESYVASMMSKLLPSQLAVGTFNSGLLIILVAMSARATADIFITILGSISIRHLLNMLIIPSTCLVATSMLLVWRNFEALAV